MTDDFGPESLRVSDFLARLPSLTRDQWGRITDRSSILGKDPRYTSFRAAWRWRRASRAVERARRGSPQLQEALAVGLSRVRAMAASGSIPGGSEGVPSRASSAACLALILRGRVSEEAVAVLYDPFEEVAPLESLGSP